MYTRHPCHMQGYQSYLEEITITILRLQLSRIFWEHLLPAEGGACTWFIISKFVFITARKQSLGQGNIFTGMCKSFCSQGGGGLCMMSLPIWLPGPMLILGESLSLVLCSPCSFQGVLCPWCLCPGGIFPEVSVQGVSPDTHAETPLWRRAGGIHPTGMLCCFSII